MKLPEIFKNKINVDENDNKYYRGSFKEENVSFPMKCKIKYQNRILQTTFINETTNYYITKDGLVLYKDDIEIITRY